MCRSKNGKNRTPSGRLILRTHSTINLVTLYYKTVVILNNQLQSNNREVKRKVNKKINNKRFVLSPVFFF